jgi:Phosphoinositide phospholipase C, Ca2+-dependent
VKNCSSLPTLALLSAITHSQLHHCIFRIPARALSLVVLFVLSSCNSDSLDKAHQIDSTQSSATRTARSAIASEPAATEPTATSAAMAELRLNQVQFIGTHNSYHIAASPELTAFLNKLRGKQETDQINTLDYTHLPLTDQLELGIRHFELDIYRDTKGGTFAKPLSLELLNQERVSNNKTVTPYDPDGLLNQPGFKVIHVADYDVDSRCLLFRQCLEQIKAWSDKHPNDGPVMIQIEAKNTGISVDQYETAKPEPFTGQAWRAFQNEILAVFPRERLITPGDVRGSYATLNQAVLNHNWPTLKQAAGKVMFMLDNTDETMRSYVTEMPELAERFVFISVEPGHPAAAWIKMNSPEDDRIPERVKQGYLVRTRADASTMESRNNNTTTRERAFASGAQFISTDYPKPDLRFSDYQVVFPDNRYARCNPIAHPQHCQLR